jgi:8-oxo-dGTP diphosphatase
MDEKKFRKTIKDLRVAVAAIDVVLFTVKEDQLCVFLTSVDRPPHYKNLHGLPGGIIGVNENADQAAVRHLKEKTNITGIHIEQLYTFSDPERDQRSRAISIAYMALASVADIDQKEVAGGWFSIKKLPPLAYDHAEIITMGLERLRGKLTYTNIVANLVPKQFTLSELQDIHEIILGDKSDKRNFRKKVLASQIIKPVVGEFKKTVHKPAQLYTFS